MILIFVLLFMSISIVRFSLYTGISPMPSSRLAKTAIVNFLISDCLKYQHVPQVNISSVKHIYELGSGWGGLALQIATKFPKATLKAFEISLVPWLISKIIGEWRGSTNVQFYRKNFFKESLSQADIIICYLYPAAMTKLKVKFEKELQPGTWVISNTFAIPGWVPYQRVELENLWKTQILVYQVGHANF